MTYRIICYYGCFAKEIVEGGCLSKMALYNLIPDYFDNYIVMETGDRWDAIAKFATEYHRAKVDLNVYDFQDTCDCVSVTFYTLQEYDKNGNLVDIILESDFPTVNVNE